MLDRLCASYIEKQSFIDKLNKQYIIADKYDRNVNPFSIFRGNLMFQSKNIFEGHSMSRRDDIISLIYVLINMINPNVLKVDSTLDVFEQYKFFKRCKCFLPVRELILDEASNKFMDLLNYAYSIEFLEKPDYNKLRYLLKKILLDIDQVPSPNFVWSIKAYHPFQRVTDR